MTNFTFSVRQTYLWFTGEARILEGITKFSRSLSR